jgi:hypothetical protein
MESYSSKYRTFPGAHSCLCGYRSRRNGTERGIPSYQLSDRIQEVNFLILGRFGETDADLQHLWKRNLRFDYRVQPMLAM